MLNPINVLIVNYNTRKFTDACIQSVNKNTPNATIYVVDNSSEIDEVISESDYKNVRVINNYNHQLCDVLDAYPEDTWRLGDSDHTYAVLYFIDTYLIPFVLLDSDVIVKCDLHKFVSDPDKVVIGTIATYTSGPLQLLRIDPALCYINAPKLNAYSIKFFDKRKMFHNLNPENASYTTGVAFYLDIIENVAPEDCKFISEYELDMYACHHVGGSWKKGLHNKFADFQNSVYDWEGLNSEGKEKYNYWADVEWFLRDQYNNYLDIPALKRAICLVLTDNYIHYGKALLKSLVDNNPWYDGKVVIIGDQYALFSESSLRTLQEIYPNTDYYLFTRTKLIEDFIAKFEPHMMRPNFYWSYLKLYLFELEEFDLILYLDSDIIVKGDISKMFLFTGNIAMTSDNSWYSFFPESDNPYLTDTWLLRKDEYCNAGVILLGNKSFRRSFRDDFLEYAMGFDFMPRSFSVNNPWMRELVIQGQAFEQDMLNLYLKDKHIHCYLLPVKYNTHVFNDLLLLESAAIVHYWIKPEHIVASTYFYSNKINKCLEYFNKYADNKIYQHKKDIVFYTCVSTEIYEHHKIKDWVVYCLNNWDCNIYMFIDKNIPNVKDYYDIAGLFPDRVFAATYLDLEQELKNMYHSGNFLVNFLNHMLKLFKHDFNWMCLTNISDRIHLDSELLKKTDEYELYLPIKRESEVRANNPIEYHAIVNLNSVDRIKSQCFGSNYGHYIDESGKAFNKEEINTTLLEFIPNITNAVNYTVRKES